MPATKASRMSTASGTPRSEFSTATATMTTAATMTMRVMTGAISRPASPDVTRRR